MTIDKEQLISLLEEKTGLEREQVEGQLSELIGRIQKVAEEGKDFEIEGFGTFSMKDDGLQFTPADKLETEINNKYAGMKPIELIGAFKEPESEEEVPEVDLGEDAKEDEKWAFDTDAVNESEEDEEVPVSETSESSEKEPEKVEAQKAPQPSKKEDAFEDDEDLDASVAASSEEISAEKTEELTSTEKEEKQEVSSVDLDTFLVAAVIVLAVGLGGWMVYEMGFSGNNSSIAENAEQPTETTTSSTESPSQQSPSGVSDDEKSNPEPEQSSAVTNEQETNEESSNQQQNTYGLRGDPNRDINDGYTIVVHSLKNEQKAERNRKQLQEAGFRALISQAEVQGQTYYRVGIGQFKTVAEAQEATVNIPQRYKDSNFIKRIQ